MRQPGSQDFAENVMGDANITAQADIGGFAAKFRGVSADNGLAFDQPCLDAVLRHSAGGARPRNPTSNDQYL